MSKTSRSIVGDKDDSVRFQALPDRKLLRPIPKKGHSRAPSTSMQPPFCKGGYGSRPTRVLDFPDNRGIRLLMTLNEFPEVRDLPAMKKLELVDEIWKDIGRELDDMELSAEEKQLLDSRWAEFIKNPDSALSSDEFMERLNARRR